jgi:hypothetical protein
LFFYYSIEIYFTPYFHAICVLEGYSLNPFSAAITEHDSLGNLQRIKVYLAHGSGGSQSKVKGPHLVKVFLMVGNV